MPLTPYHVGPALLVALILYPLLDIPTFVIANIILDIEPLAIILLGLNEPLHGRFHSLTLGSTAAFMLAAFVHLFRTFMSPIKVKRSLPQNPSFRNLLITSLAGVWFHVILDAFLYSDIKLLYPLGGNPLLGLLSQSQVYRLCTYCFPAAIIMYLIRVYLLDMGKPPKSTPEESEEAEEPESLYFEPENLNVPESEPMFFSPLEELSIPESEPFLSDDGLNIPAPVYEPEPLFPAEPEPPFISIPDSIEAPPEPKPSKPAAARLPGSFPEVFIGTDKTPSQWGILGRTLEKLVAVDLNEPHIVFVCGKQGSGKGYTIGVLSEMLLSKTLPGISSVEKPATIIVFHKPREDIRSEYWSIIEPNHNPKEKELLLAGYNVEPRRVISNSGLRVFVDPFVYKNERSKFENEYGGKVYPIGIVPKSLTAEDWPYVLSIGKKSGSMYVKKIFQIIKKTQYDKDFGLKMIRRKVDASDLNPTQKSFAMMRLETLQDYLDAGDFVKDLKIGGVNIFDLRKIMMEPDDIFSVMMLVISSILNNSPTEREQFVFVINEAHDYLRKGLSKDFTDYISYLIRKKRHAGTWLMLDTHFPEDVDPKIIKGSDVKIFHKSDIISSTILRQSLEGTTSKPHMLNTGEAIIRADKSSEGPDRIYKVNVRPRLTHHGGATKTAI